MYTLKSFIRNTNVIMQMARCENVLKINRPTIVATMLFNREMLEGMLSFQIRLFVPTLYSVMHLQIRIWNVIVCETRLSALRDCISTFWLAGVHETSFFVSCFLNVWTSVIRIHSSPSPIRLITTMERRITPAPAHHRLCRLAQCCNYRTFIEEKGK